jgi:hypothetical protein
MDVDAVSDVSEVCDTSIFRNFCPEGVWFEYPRVDSIYIFSEQDTRL